MFSFLLGSLDSLLFFLPGIRRKRERRQAWTGTVEAKKAKALSKHAYLVIFRTDDGRKKRIPMDRKGDFDLYEEGRRYAKKAGDDLPEMERRT